MVSFRIIRLPLGTGWPLVKDAGLVILVAAHWSLEESYISS